MAGKRKGRKVTREMDEKLKQLIRSNLEEQFINGMYEGTRGMCGSFYEIISNDELNNEQKVFEMKKICEAFLNANKEHSDNGAEE